MTQILRQLLTLREALVGQGNLTGQQIEVEAAEDAAERRDGDETVGGTCLGDRKKKIGFLAETSSCK